MRATLTPQLEIDAGDTELVLVDLGAATASAARCSRRCTRSWAAPRPTSTIPRSSAAFFDRSRRSTRARCSPITTVPTAACSPRCARWRSRRGRARDQAVARATRLAELFNEELGAVLQVRPPICRGGRACRRNLSEESLVIGQPVAGEHPANRARNPSERRVELHRAWSATHRIQRMRDNPVCATRNTTGCSTGGSRASRRCSRSIPRGHRRSIHRDRRAARGSRSCASRASTVRSRWRRRSTAPAFEAVDVHMSDILAGRADLRIQGFAACGGFSYGDVLGAGEGWAKSILFNARARDEFAAFFARADTFALGVCNGCQMMTNLHDSFRAPQHWPHFVRNRVRAVRGAAVAWSRCKSRRRSVLRRHGGQPHADRGGARRGPRRVQR